MGWFSQLFGSSALSNPDEGVQVSGPTIIKTDANISVTDERAMMVSALFACVRLLVQTGSTLPMGFYRRTPDGRESLPESHHLCQLLKYRPNNFMTAKEFRSALWTQRVLWGNAYALIKRLGGRPVSLVPLKPDCMTVEREKNGLVYTYRSGSDVKTYQQNEILHLKGFGDGVMGMSALAHARHVLGISVSADRYASKAFSGKPNGVLKIDRILTNEQREQLRKVYGGLESSSAYNADGQLMILEGGMGYEGISLPPDDLQMLQSRTFQVSEICRFLGVPTVMVDGSAGATAAWPASYEQQVLSFLTFTLKPYLEEWEDKVPYSLLDGTERVNVFAEHNVEGLLRTDSQARAAYLSTMVQNGLMSRNESRMKLNLPPVEGGDELTVQVNLTGINDLPQATQGRNDAA